MAVKRRTVLKLGLGGTLVLALGGVGLAFRPTVYVAPQGPLKHMSLRQYSVLFALADCIVAPSDDMPSIADLQVVETMDEMLSQVHPEDIKQILQAVSLLENAFMGLVLDGRIQTFTGASREARAEILEGWRKSVLSVKQQAYSALHDLCVAAYWGNPKAYPATGYMGPPDFSGLVPEVPADG